MPESYPQEHLHRAQCLLGGSREEQVYELSMVIYLLSNNILNPRQEHEWNRNIGVLETSGLLEISVNLKILKS